MSDKSGTLEQEVDMKDPNAVRAFQNSCTNTVKDLKALEDKIAYLKKLAEEVLFCFGTLH